MLQSSRASIAQYSQQQLYLSLFFSEPIIGFDPQSLQWSVSSDLDLSLSNSSNETVSYESDGWFEGFTKVSIAALTALTLNINHIL